VLNLIPIEVIWEDSRRNTGSTIFDNDEFENYPLAIIHSIGFGKIFKDKIVLASEYYPLIDCIQDEQVRTIYSIPRSCVKKIIELKTGKEIR
jgi:hypothetical protein